MWNFDIHRNFDKRSFEDLTAPVVLLYHVKGDSDLQVLPALNPVSDVRNPSEECKEEAIQEVTPNSEFIGYDYKQFQQIYPQWNIELFTDDKIKMSLQVNDYCQVHIENIFIGISEGKQVVTCMVMGYPKVKYLRTVPRKTADICWK